MPRTAVPLAPAAAPVAPAAPAPTRRRSRRLYHPSNYLFLVPAVVLMGALVYFSLGYTAYLSTLDTNGISPKSEFVGLANFVQVFSDPGFWMAVRNVGIFFLLIPVQLALGFGFAVVLGSRIKFPTIYKVVIFLPVVLAPAVMAPVFVQMFSPGGQIHALLEALGLGSLAHAWLADPSTAIWVLGLIQIWSGTGFCFVLYLAGLSQIDGSVIEAARMDGAGNLRMVWSILLPMVRQSTVTLVVLSTIGTIKIFDIPQIITQGGPANSTQFLATYIYQQTIKNYAAGYGAALTVVLVIACLGLAMLQLRMSRRDNQ